VIPPGDTVRVAAADPYQILDPKRAATDGYGLTAIAFDRLRRGRQPTDPNDALLAKLPATRKEAWHLAFSGDIRRRLTIKLPDGQSVTSPADGCMFQAHRKIYGADWDTIFYRLQLRDPGSGLLQVPALASFLADIQVVYTAVASQRTHVDAELAKLDAKGLRPLRPIVAAAM